METEHSEFVMLGLQYNQLQDDYLHLQEEYYKLRERTEAVDMLPNPPDTTGKLPLLSFERQ